MTDSEIILVEILATTDAIFRPYRAADWTFSAPSNLHEAKQRFRAVGVAIDGGGTEGHRKQQQRDLEALETDGLIVLGGGLRRNFARLTDLGDEYARALAGRPGLNEAVTMMENVFRLSKLADGGLMLCSELWLCGLENYTPNCTEKLLILSEIFAPVVWRGWVESRSDVLGRAYYFATDAGKAAAKLPPPILPAGLPEFDEAACDLYFQKSVDTRAGLRTARPSHPAEIGECPVSASLDFQRPRRRKVKV